MTGLSAPASAGQRAPALVYQPGSGGASGSYFLVWEDDRNRAAAGRDLWGVRIDSTGRARSSGAQLLSASARAGDQLRPALVAAPTASPVGPYLVWTDAASGDIYGALLSGALAPSPSGGRRLSLGAAADDFARVAWDGTRFLVAWQTAGGPAIEGQRLRANGALDGARVRLSGAAGGRSPDVLGGRGRSAFAYATAAGAAQAGQIASSGSAGPTSRGIGTSTGTEDHVRLGALGSRLRTARPRARRSARRR